MIFLQESLCFQAGWKSWSGFPHSVEMSRSALIPTRVWRSGAAGACLHRHEARKASRSVLLTNQQSVQSNSNCGGPLTASRSSDCKASQAGWVGGGGRKTQPAARQIEFVWRKVLDTVEGHGEKIKPGTDRPGARRSFVRPCKECYVTTDCLQSHIWWGKSPHLDRPESQTSLSKTHYRATRHVRFTFGYAAIYVYAIKF